MEERSESRSKDRGVKDPNTTRWRRVPVRHTAMLVKVLQCLDSTSAKELEGGFLQAVGSDTNLMTPPIQSYTNHARKCVRSRSGTHGKISQHNSTNKNKSYKHHNTSQGPRGLEYKCSIIDESAEATISEYRHKLNKFALRRLAQTGVQIERGAGLLPGILLNYSWSSSAGCT